MAVRAKRNAVKIEGWRLSRIPVGGSADIYSGDMVCWDANAGAGVAAASASGASFIGVTEQSTKVPSLGVLTSDQQLPRVTVLQQGLVEMISGAAATIKAFDSVYIGSDAQSVVFTGSNAIGMVDPAMHGKTVAIGDIVLVWILVPDAYRCFK